MKLVQLPGSVYYQGIRTWDVANLKEIVRTDQQVMVRTKAQCRQGNAGALGVFPMKRMLLNQRDGEILGRDLVCLLFITR